MVDQTLFLKTLSEFARTLVGRYEIADVLYQLVDRVTVLLGVAGTGVSLGKEGQLRFVTGVNEATVRVEQVQDRTQEGVCAEAYRIGRLVTLDDLDALGGRWKEFQEAARKAGFAAVAGIPMAVHGEVLGVLNLYSSVPRAWSDDDLATAGVLADMATSYLLNASELEESRRTNEQLEKALQSRIVIEQAKGVVAAERKVSMDRAYEILRKHARDHNASLQSVAAAVVNLGLRP